MCRLQVDVKPSCAGFEVAPGLAISAWKSKLQKGLDPGTNFMIVRLLLESTNSNQAHHFGPDGGFDSVG